MVDFVFASSQVYAWFERIFETAGITSIRHGLFWAKTRGERQELGRISHQGTEAKSNEELKETAYSWSSSSVKSLHTTIGNELLATKLTNDRDGSSIKLIIVIYLSRVSCEHHEHLLFYPLLITDFNAASLNKFLIAKDPLVLINSSYHCFNTLRLVAGSPRGYCSELWNLGAGSYRELFCRTYVEAHTGYCGWL